MVLVIALAVTVAILLPAYVVYEVRVNRDAILLELEESRMEANETAIRVNVTTIACLLLIAPEDRTVFAMNTCIREGLAEFPEEEFPE